VEFIAAFVEELNLMLNYDVMMAMMMILMTSSLPDYRLHPQHLNACCLILSRTV